MTAQLTTAPKRQRKSKLDAPALDLFAAEDPARVEWRKARDFGRCSAETMRQLAEAVKLEKGHAWRVFRRVDMAPLASMGGEVLEKILDAFYADVDLACDVFGVRESEDSKPGESAVMWSWGGHIGWRELWPHQAFEEWQGFWRFHTLVVKVSSREDVEILRSRSKQSYVPHEGSRAWCDPFDPRTVSARAWGPVLFEHGSLVARLNGRSGDAVVAWLRQLFGRGAWHGIRLVKDADPGIFCGPADVQAILNALVACGWILRGAMEPTIEHQFFTPLKWAKKNGTSDEYVAHDPTLFVYMPNRENAEALALLRAEDAPRTCPPQFVYHAVTMRWIREVYRRGRVHGSELAVARATTPDGWMEDGSANGILDELSRLGYVTTDRQSEPTVDQRFLGTESGTFRNSAVSYVYEPQRDRSRWVEFPAWMHDIIASTPTGEPAPRPEEEASR